MIEPTGAAILTQLDKLDMLFSFMRRNQKRMTNDLYMALVYTSVKRVPPHALFLLMLMNSIASQ